MLFTFTFLVHAGLNFVLGLAAAAVLGPAEFGRYAIGAAVAVLVNALCFYWLCSSAARYYTEAVRVEKPQIRATLDRVLAIIATIIVVAALAVAVAWPSGGFPGNLIALGMVAGLAQGIFDYVCTLARARFLDRLFVRLVLIKTFAGFVLMLAAALWTGNAQVVMAAMVLSIVVGMWSGARALSDQRLLATRIDPALLREFVGYSAPLILSLVVYQLMPFVNRGLIASVYGYAESGQFSLAYDTLSRIVFALGASLEFILFQLAVRADEQEGRGAAEAQLGRNVVLVCCLLLPAAVGFWLLMPAIAHAIVPTAFQEGFLSYAGWLLPAVVAQAAITSALNGVFQIQKRTAPAAAAAIAAIAVNLLLCFILPPTFGAAGYAFAQVGGIAAAFATTLVFAFPVLRREIHLRDLGFLGLGLAVMAAALVGWSDDVGPWLALALGIPLGAACYGAVIVAGDVAGIRAFALARLKRSAP
jgi:O-antigen/teichoic acid export membrane protein